MKMYSEGTPKWEELGQVYARFVENVSVSADKLIENAGEEAIKEVVSMVINVDLMFDLFALAIERLVTQGVEFPNREEILSAIPPENLSHFSDLI